MSPEAWATDVDAAAEADLDEPLLPLPRTAKNTTAAITTTATTIAPMISAFFLLPPSGVSPRWGPVWVLSSELINQLFQMCIRDSR